MSKLIMMRGLPASGKSTEAEKIMKETGNCVRVNRDLLREMLHFNKWTGKNEGYTIRSEVALAAAHLVTGMNVIVDDCNLSQKNRDQWSRLAQECNAKFEVRDMGVDFITCLMRDREREKQVGDHVIYKMALANGMVRSKGNNEIVICDIDGTLADITHRRHHVLKEKKDWNSFFEEMDGDPVRKDVLEKLFMLWAEGYDIFFVSGRPEKYRARTERWLAKHGFQSKMLLMREDHDKREDTIVKKEIFDKYLSRYKVKCVIDDRPSVIRMWKANGMEVIDVGDGVEF